MQKRCFVRGASNRLIFRRLYSRCVQRPKRLPGTWHLYVVPPQARRTSCASASNDTVSVEQSPTKYSGRSTYRPASFQELVNDASSATMEAMAAGERRLEVEFPPVPTNVESYKGASDMYIDSNIQLAISGAKVIAATGKRVHVLMPDYNEYARAYNMFKAVLQMTENVTLGHVKELDGGMANPFANLFGSSAPSSKEFSAGADVYLAINLTCVELPALDRYTLAACSGNDKTMVAWNLELDTLRGDLGLLGYPPKELHYRFLSTFKPAFYLRPRDYSKSVGVAPFIVNYSGALFREYPGPWQVMLKQDSGEYAVIAEDKARYDLGEVKEEMTTAMGLNTEEAGSAMAFLRKGYKTSTWYEDDYDLEQSHNWRL